jgi:hypothetical protein
MFLRARRMPCRRGFLAGIALILCAGVLFGVPAAQLDEQSLPERISDQEFWMMNAVFSEPEGYFRSDNLLSNEIWLQNVIPDLLKRTQPGGVYLGVGPEQNFTYIAALKPKMAFITDIRLGNTYTHLMYKALFELSKDRADFVARLFTRKRPEGLEAKSTAQEIFRAFDKVQAGDPMAFRENMKAISDQLVQKHKFPLVPEDLEGIEYVYRSFHTFGPGIHYNSTSQSSGRGSGNSTSQRSGRGSGSSATYADLMTQTDGKGVSRSYLATEENYKVVKDLQERNLLIPIVGDFGGPMAIRLIGRYLKDRGATVAAFYLSNVEQYLGDAWGNFCYNVTRLPLDEKSTFIRSGSNTAPRGTAGGGGGLTSNLGSMLAETRSCGGNR